MLHGADMSTLGIVNAQNDKNDFIVVAPISANAPAGWDYQTQTSADIIYVDALYDKMIQDFNVGWVFLEGHSAGGFMTFYYGLVRSDKFAGFSTTGAFMAQWNQFGHT